MLTHPPNTPNSQGTPPLLSVYMYTCAQIPQDGKMTIHCLNLRSFTHTYFPHVLYVNVTKQSLARFSNPGGSFPLSPRGEIFTVGGRIFVRRLWRPHMWNNPLRPFWRGRHLVSACQGGNVPPEGKRLSEPVIVKCSGC